MIRLNRKKLKALIPQRYRQPVTELYRRARALWLMPGGRLSCPCCGVSVRSFVYGGVSPPRKVLCPRCLSLERHRWMTLYLLSFKPFTDRVTNATQPTPFLLHVAPENALARWLKKLPNLRYVGSDLNYWEYTADNVHLHTDLTQLAFASQSFDFIICNHVLEHIKKDRLAMCELYRVLRPGGIAFISVPVRMDQATFEDTNIRTPEARMVAFEQLDHVRIYGHDIISRLESVGFSVNIISSLDIPPDQARHHSLLRYEGGKFREEVMFICTRLV